MAQSTGATPDPSVSDPAPSTPPGRRRTVVIVTASVAIVLLVVAGVIWATRPASHKKTAAPPPPITSAAPSPSSTPSGTRTAAPTPKPKPAVPHDYVAAAAPSSFRYAGSGYTIKASVCGMEYVRPLDPPGEQHHTVCWVQHDFGFAPGSKGRGTTYVLGHSWGQDSREVLNKISAPATRQMLKLRAKGKSHAVTGVATYPVTALNGNVITLRTASGELKYTVRSAYAVAKEQAGNVQPLMADRTKNRVVIITCAELNHVDYDYNIIVQAYLTSSKATTTNT